MKRGFASAGAILGLVCGLAMASAVACSRPEGSPWRWIETSPTQLITSSDLRSVNCRQRFPFSAGKLAPGVVLSEGELLGSFGSGATLRGGSVAPRLKLVEELRTAENDALLIEVSGVRRGQVRVLWRVSGGGANGQFELGRTSGTGSNRNRFLFDLSSLGSLAEAVQIELEPTTAAGELVTVDEICAGHGAPDAGRIARLEKTPWKLTHDLETRDVLLLEGGGRAAHAGVVPTAARLLFGVASLGSPSEAAIVGVLRREAEGWVELSEQRVENSRLERGWVDLEFDLSALAGQSAEIAIAVRPEPRREGFVAALSSPRLVSRARRDGRPNILLISVDTLRADRLSMYGHSRATSTRLDDWAARRATVFEHAVAPAPWTLPSHFSLFTGIEAFAHPANYNSISFDASAYRFLARELWQAGYSTRALTGGSYVSPEFGLASGFERFRVWFSTEERADELSTQVEELSRFFAQGPEEPFFVFFHTYEVHTPNAAREPWFSRFHGSPDSRIVNLGRSRPPKPEEGFLGTTYYVLRSADGTELGDVGAGDIAFVKDIYDSAVAYTDDQLGNLIDRLDRSGLGARTVVALVADHGESLGEEGRAGHGNLSDENLHVPMVLSVPELEPRARRVTTQVRLHDLYPTLLELAGVRPLPASDGKSLLGLARGEPGVDRVATAYAAPTNLGLARLFGDGEKLEWRNFVWNVPGGALRWSRSSGARPPADLGLRAERERRLGTEYQRRAIGLRLEVSTNSRRDVRVDLVSDLVDPVSMKASRLDSPTIAWRDIGSLESPLSVERPLGLLFQRLPRDEVALELTVREAGCDKSAKGTLEGAVGDFRDGKALDLVIPNCTPDGDRVSVRAIATWIGPVPGSQWQPGERGLQEQLRALGYLP